MPEEQPTREVINGRIDTPTSFNPELQKLTDKEFRVRVDEHVSEKSRDEIAVEIVRKAATVDSTITLARIEATIKQLTAEKKNIENQLEYWTTLRGKVDTEVEKVKPIE